MEFLPLSRRRSSARNVPSYEERGETDVFAGYVIFGITTTCDISKLSQLYHNLEISLVLFMPNITTNHAISYTYTVASLFPGVNTTKKEIRILIN